MFKFEKKVAVVTGAGSGIGRSICMNLAKRGCLVIAGDISAEKALETANLSENIEAKTIDVADRQQVFDLAKSVHEQHGQIDMMFNNAGVTISDSAADISYEDFKWLLDINFWGVVHGSQAFLPYLKQSKESFLINLSSVFGLVGIPGQAAYCASKFAVRGFTESLRLELSDTNVTTICVHPGGIKTDIARNAKFNRGALGAENHEELIKNFDTLAITSPEQAATKIINAIIKKQERPRIGIDAKLMDYVQRVMPASYYSLLGMLVKPRSKRQS
ncbi:MAG: hypothetical protein CMP10_07485 [Zetaproteobacteria bacterium]|nr:hypothetical protein [Pseudobdellovibrionaceae bacterium]